MRSLTFATLFCAMSCRADRQPGPAAAEPDWYRAVGADWPLPAAPGQAAAPGPAFHHQPDARRSYAWAEHPTGALALRPNGQGFREDAETAPAPVPGRPRWVALGDSHTDGVAPNAETWPNRLEARLAAAGVDVEGQRQIADLGPALGEPHHLDALAVGQQQLVAPVAVGVGDDHDGPGRRRLDRRAAPVAAGPQRALGQGRHHPARAPVGREELDLAAAHDDDIKIAGINGFIGETP
jgi:hypothetical protein